MQWETSDEVPERLRCVQVTREWMTMGSPAVAFKSGAFDEPGVSVWIREVEQAGPNQACSVSIYIKSGRSPIPTRTYKRVISAQPCAATRSNAQ